MEPTVVLALVGAAIAVLIARGQQATPERERVPVRVDDDPQPTVRRR
jgi:hypothetical protein